MTQPVNPTKPTNNNHEKIVRFMFDRSLFALWRWGTTGRDVFARACCYDERY